MEVRTINGKPHVKTAYAYPEILDEVIEDGKRFFVRHPQSPTRPARTKAV